MHNQFNQEEPPHGVAFLLLCCCCKHLEIASCCFAVLRSCSILLPAVAKRVDTAEIAVTCCSPGPVHGIIERVENRQIRRGRRSSILEIFQPTSAKPLSKSDP